MLAPYTLRCTEQAVLQVEVLNWTKGDGSRIMFEVSPLAWRNAFKLVQVWL